jgi:hypothetical protein
VRIRINLERATEEMFAGLKSAADAAPGPGKVMLHLEKKGEYAVILEPEGMSVAADRGWVERVEELVNGRAGDAREMGGHAPIGDVGVIEGGLEGLVFDQHALIGAEVAWVGAQASSSQPMRLRMLCVPG